MSELIKLYRGDNVFIDMHKTKETNSYNYLGKGIYLTESLKVAESYLLKNENNGFGRNGTLTLSFDRPGMAKDIPHALEKFYQNFLDHYAYAKYNIDAKRILEDKKYKKELQECRKAFEEWIASGYIVSKYVNGGKTITITATDPKAKEIGHISEFHIPSHLLEHNVLRCEYLRTSEKRLWEIVHAEKLSFGLHDPNVDKDTFMQQVGYSSGVLYQMNFESLLNYGNQTDPEKNPMNRKYLDNEIKRREKMIRVFKRHGVKGFEYSGGRLIGGLGHHRAFSIWDDNWIHEFRVK